VELFVADQCARLERGLIIASAGCTAFSMLTRPGRWTALDFNPEQIQLCQLKRALLRQRSREEVEEALQGNFVLDGLQLPEETRRYWTPRVKKLNHGLNHSGRADRMLDALAWFYRRWLQRPGEVEAFFHLEDPAIQRLRFEQRWNTPVWRLSFRLALANPLLRLVFGALTGVFPRDFSELLRGQVEQALTERAVASNLYLWQLFLGRYPEGHCPVYLEQLETIRPRLDQLDLVQADLPGWLAAQPSDSLDFLGFSNVLETASEVEAERLCALTARAARSGALVVFRRIVPRSHQRAAEGQLRFRPDLTRDAAGLESGCFCRTVEVFEVL
jgi:S-adenosylmethionine:diacylglycerol 3-amino-3-carboxypropyl transferase